jgi:hypothetical protein
MYLIDPNMVMIGVPIVIGMMAQNGGRPHSNLARVNDRITPCDLQ